MGSKREPKEASELPAEDELSEPVPESVAPAAGETSPSAEQESAPLAEADSGPESAAELKDRWLRAEAELQNYRRRAARDREEIQRLTEDRYLLEVVSLLDDLERALESAEEEGAPEAWVQGVALVAQRARDLLARQGVQPIEALGNPFDPQFHEAMMQVEASAEVVPGSVVQILRKGYRRQGRALRPARVAVAAASTPVDDHS